MAAVPRQRTDLTDEDAKRLQAAWSEFRQRQDEAERSRKALVRLLVQLQKKYPVASIARAAGVSAPTVWSKVTPR